MRALSYGSFGELLYAMPMPTPAYVNSTTRTCVSPNTATFRAFKLPADYFQPQLGGSGQSLRVIARGAYGTTTGPPTLQLQVAFDTTQGTFGTVVAGTGAYSAETSLTFCFFELEFDLCCTATGTSGTVQSGGTYQHGSVAGASGNAATGAASNLMVGAVNPLAVNTTVDNYVEVWATWGTANALNTLTLTQFLIFALN